MLELRHGVVRSGPRKPKPRRTGGSSAVFFFSAPVWVCWLSQMLLAAAVAQDGVAFNVPATVQCEPLEMVALAAEPTQTQGRPSAAPSNVQLAGYRRITDAQPSLRYYLISLEVMVVFSEVEKFDTVICEVMPLSRRGRVVDYYPKTQLNSDFAGEISSESIRSRNLGLNSNLNAGWPGVGNAAFQLNGHHQENSVQREVLKAPMIAVVTSGISQRGRGAFFRFNAARESVIEGGQRLDLIIEAPSTWQGDLLQIHCLARGPKDSVQQSYLTAVTVLGDERNFALAEKFAAADHRTEQLLARIQVAKRPAFSLEEIESTLMGRRAREEPTRVQRIRHSLQGATTAQQVFEFEKLSPVLQESINDLLHYKRAVLKLAVGGPQQ